MGLIFLSWLQAAPEQYSKEPTKSSISVAQASCPSSSLQLEKQSNGRHSKKGMNFGETTHLTNGHHGLTNGESSQESMPEVKHHERGRTREKREENRLNDEFFSHISTTVQNLQKDLDRITGRVRCLEGQVLKALAPVPVSDSIFLKLSLVFYRQILYSCEKSPNFWENVQNRLFRYFFTNDRK